MLEIILFIIWIGLSGLFLVKYAPMCSDLPLSDKACVCFILIIGGPFFVISNLLEIMLDGFLPDGWDDDDFK